jgi:hypothetical protein
MLHLRARCAVTLAAGKDSATWLRCAERDARALHREKILWPEALALLIDAALAFRRGDAKRSGEILNSAMTAFEKVEMRLHAAVARRRLGQLVGGSEGQELVRRAEEWMTGQKIRNFDRMTRMLAPGWDGT